MHNIPVAAMGKLPSHHKTKTPSVRMRMLQAPGPFPYDNHVNIPTYVELKLNAKCADVSSMSEGKHCSLFASSTDAVMTGTRGMNEYKYRLERY